MAAGAPIVSVYVRPASSRWRAEQDAHRSDDPDIITTFGMINMIGGECDADPLRQLLRSMDPAADGKRAIRT